MPYDPQFDDYVSSEKAALFREPVKKGRSEKVNGHVIWGDGVRILKDDPAAGRVEIKARNSRGWIDREHLGGRSLLEFYIIDVGQGDGLLIKTPDFRHIMIDGGYPRRAQPTGKSAADFVDWKFCKDYGHDTIVLDAMISSHIDYDHYGGLDDILDPAQDQELDCRAISVEAFYHSGLSHWVKPGSKTSDLGPHAAAHGKRWFTRLLDDRASAQAGLSGSGPQLKGYWAKLIDKVLAARTASGAPTPMARLDQSTGWLPGFDENDPVAIRVLGPISGQTAQGPGVLRLASENSQNTNGTSVLLRVDYGATRCLLTGDLNKASHHALLELYEGQEREFACDVAKACHHGSEDVSYSFLNHVKAACTVISSGDDEGHDHPRPRVVAASGLSGYATFKDDQLVTPLVYSTELARSVSVGRPTAVTASAQAGGRSYPTADLGQLRMDYTYTGPGALRPSRFNRAMDRSRAMHRLLYGLVNVRTDGRKILCATMDEGDGAFSVKTFESRFE
jgi:beta-lactamase superfamily II metal-dependent hydrolase